MFSILFDRMVRSYAYVEVVMEFDDVLKRYPNWSFSSHSSTSSKKMVNMYGLRVSLVVVDFNEWGGDEVGSLEGGG